MCYTPDISGLLNLKKRIPMLSEVRIKIQASVDVAHVCLWCDQVTYM